MDANGAISHDGRNAYTYDARGRLLSVANAAGTTHALIDPLGRRLAKRNGQDTLYFTYDNAGHLIAETDASGQPRQEHLWANDTPLAVLWPQDRPGGAERLLDNTDPAFSVTGTWTASTAVAGYQGTNYLAHAGDADPVGTRLLDNPQGSASGTWTASTAVAGYQGSNYLTHPAATTGSDAFTWTTALEPGSYDVYARWTAHANRAGNARYRIGHAGGETVVTVDQRANGGVWNPLGRHAFGASGTVSLDSAADGYVIADAVKFVPADAGYDTATWRPGVPGSYDVYARWTAHANRAGNARYRIGHAGGEAVVTVDQRLHGGMWNRLGTFALTAGSEIALSSAADGYVIADALRLVPSASFPATALAYVQTDQLGTPRALVTPGGKVVWTWDGEAFGNTPANGDADGDGAVMDYRLRFPGQYFDGETNTHYNYFRDYDPGTGRYLQSDPIGLDGGINTYIYVNGNPLRFVDPEGLSVTDPNGMSGGSDWGTARATHPWSDDSHSPESSESICRCDEKGKTTIRCFVVSVDISTPISPPNAPSSISWIGFGPTGLGYRTQMVKICKCSASNDWYVGVKGTASAGIGPLGAEASVTVQAIPPGIQVSGAAGASTAGYGTPSASAQVGIGR